MAVHPARERLAADQATLDEQVDQLTQVQAERRERLIRR
ncbi:MAG: hypothetical protein AVDCRST_MAG93-7279 [uncultured Chloroflexia bacterium]|uniref:Uncharacterized protein n=1 Tax=uncultured Chloroflexia bacterium TaxID=1672391 RepID=A0A6J4MCR1_9CHLR|nr:MAG: hypothetical protein AVDCRST_MAG93-7279 [uncultured Chloroflexia bacterium]